MDNKIQELELRNQSLIDDLDLLRDAASGKKVGNPNSFSAKITLSTIQFFVEEYAKVKRNEMNLQALNGELREAVNKVTAERDEMVLIAGDYRQQNENLREFYIAFETPDLDILIHSDKRYAANRGHSERLNRQKQQQLLQRALQRVEETKGDTRCDIDPTPPKIASKIPNACPHPIDDKGNHKWIIGYSGGHRQCANCFRFDRMLSINPIDKA